MHGVNSVKLISQLNFLFDCNKRIFYVGVKLGLSLSLSLSLILSLPPTKVTKEINSKNNRMVQKNV